MSVSLSRTTSNSNTSDPYGPWKYYEKLYSSTGVQETIYLPDCDPVGISISSAGAFSATLECSDSPPDVIAAGNGVWITNTTVNTVSANASFILQAYSAIRLNIASGAVKISVRA